MVPSIPDTAVHCSNRASGVTQIHIPHMCDIAIVASVS